jgi:hypothetical protein
MWSKKTFLSATAVLMLTTVANADLVLTLNGLDAVKESVEIKGKNNLIIAVAGSTEVEPEDCFIKADGGVIEAIAEANTVSPQAKTGEYSFTFEDELVPSTVSMIANNDMIIDGTSVKAGDTIYELVLFYISETDTVMAIGVNLEILSYTPSEPESKPAPEPQPVPELKLEPKAEAQAEPVPAIEPSPKPQPKPFQPLSDQEHKRLKRLRHFPEVSESVSLKDWGAEERWRIDEGGGTRDEGGGTRDEGGGTRDEGGRNNKHRIRGIAYDGVKFHIYRDSGWHCDKYQYYLGF